MLSDFIYCRIKTSQPFFLTHIGRPYIPGQLSKISYHNINSIVISFQTTHQLDVALSSLPNTSSVLMQAVPMLRISFISGQTEALVEQQETPVMQDASGVLLMLGGNVVEAVTQLTVNRSTTITGLPYWFHIKGRIVEASPSLSSETTHSENDVVLSTFCEDSPCNQSVFMLKQPLEVEAGEDVLLKVLWRKGVFSATLDRC